MAQLIHRDKPLVDQPEHELGVASPAYRLAVFVVFELVVDAAIAQQVENYGVYFVYRFAAQNTEAVDIDAALVERER